LLEFCHLSAFSVYKQLLAPYPEKKVKQSAEKNGKSDVQLTKLRQLSITFLDIGCTVSSVLG